MKKIFKVLANVSKIFEYVNIFKKVSEGLRIATIAIETTISEIKNTNPDFKYLSTLESLYSFVNTVKQVVDSFNGIFGVTNPPDGRLISECVEKRDFAEDLNGITSDIKEML